MKRSETNKIFLFTLVELLVVASIMLILMSLLSTSLRRVMDHSESTKCMSNLKQLGNAASLYSNDFDNFFVTPFSDTNKISWDDKFSDYDGRSLTLAEKNKNDFEEGVPGSQIYDCPTDEGVYAKQNKLAKRSYGVNTDLIQCEFDFPYNNRSRRLDEVVYPNQTISLFDYPDFGYSVGEKPRLGVRDYGTARSATTSYGANQCSRLRDIMGIHKNAMNYGMFDGHVENLHPRETENGLFVYPHFFMWSPILSRR